MADMLDDEKHEGEEYEFGGEESYTPEYEEATAEAEVEPTVDVGMDEPAQEMAMGESNPIMKKMVSYGLIALGTLAVGGYLMYTQKGPTTEQEGVAQQDISVPPKIEQAAVTSEPTPVVQPEPTQVVEPPQPTEPVGTVADAARQDEQINTLAQQVKTNQLTLDNLQVRLETIQDTLKKGMDDLQANISKVKAAPVVVKKVVAKKKYRPKPMYRLSAPPREIFSLKAVLPGRAWVGSQMGGALTVTVGDYVPGYGSVRHIDAANGRVVMSSGAVIVYGPGDF